MNKLLFTRREAAVALNISAATIENLVRSGQLRSVKIGRSVRINAADLEQFAQTGTANRTSTGKELDALWRSKTSN